MKIKTLLLLSALALSLGAVLQGCGGSATPVAGQTGEKNPLETVQKSKNAQSSSVYKKKKKTHIASEPTSFRKYALVASGKINVRHKLTTDGPLADVHANGPIVAKTRSLNISGKITSENKLSDAVTRSFDYKSNIANDEMVTVRALKVDEFINLQNISEYYNLTKDGKVTKVTDAKIQTVAGIDGADVYYDNGTWVISGANVKITDNLKVEGNLKIGADYTFISGALMVTGDLRTTGELDINVGTPFDSALVVNKSINVEKLTTIGRVHSSGNFTAKGKVNIVGNAEIDGNVDLYDDAKINMLDNVYKAALADAQEESGKDGIDLTLVHSQLFSDVKGNNSVVLFTFVEGNYLMSEKTLHDLIESGDIKDFKFRSYLYGASINYVSQLSKTDHLSSFYKNLIRVKKELTKKYGTVKVKKYIDIAPSNLYCQFEDSSGQDVGIYLIYSIANENISTLIQLTDEQRANAIEELEHPTQIDDTTANSKIEDTNTTDTSITQNAPEEYQEIDNNISVAIASVDKDAIEKSDKEARVNEWVEYQELGAENRVVEVQEIEPNTQTTTMQRGWWKRLRHKVKKWFRRLTLTDCHKKREHGEIEGVNENQTFMNDRGDNTPGTDDWTKYVTLINNTNYCTPTAASMVMQYHAKVHYNKKSLYNNDTPESSRSLTNPYVAKWAGYLHSSQDSGTNAWNTFIRLPYRVNQEARDAGLHWGFAFSYYTAVWNRAWQFRIMKWYIHRNRPGIYHAPTHTIANQDEYHSMPIIGWKRERYSGWCAKRIWPNKNWFLLDTEFGYKQYVRFDSRSRYWKFGAISYIWVQ